MADFEYVGGELELFAEATNWKRYFTSFVAQHIGGDVLEVGAGMGANTRAFLTSTEKKVLSWTLLEPDMHLLNLAKQDLHEEPVEFLLGTIQDVKKTYDTIVYIDVLEHIPDSRGELDRAKALLNDGGKVIVLVPAFQMLFNEFDEAVGHCRRYNKRRLTQDFEGLFEVLDLAYLDSLGFGASVANKLFLHKPIPSKGNVRFWDQTLVPLSKIVDRLVLRSFGKSLVAVLAKK